MVSCLILHLFSGRSLLGFSPTSPNLVICAGSPDIPDIISEDSPQFLENKCYPNIGSSVELSLENGINGSEIEDTQRTPAVNFSSTLCQTVKDISPQTSFELHPPPTTEDMSAKDSLQVLSIDAGKF